MSRTKGGLLVFKLRSAMNLTQPMLEKLLHWPKARVGKVERGECKIYQDWALDLARVLGGPIDQFLENFPS